ncbi:MAG: sulfatase-like hydrolase/transferase [Epulopiscium sp.]|nr:sulfatase-like hydrolase/transferase [Candidatus Epulonipiscium sp.]
MNKKPNIIFILSDDQGAWAMNCAGNSDVITPNLDRLAASGLRFENFFCASPVCSPARASIMTGTIPSTHGVHDWIRGGNVHRDTPEIKDHPAYDSEHEPIQYLKELTTYTDLLAQNGYTCALSGKWHLGDSLTPQHGFSKWFTIGRGGCEYYKADIVRDGKIYIEDRYITDVITEDALKNIDELSEEKKPFYLSVHYTAPHSPWDEKNHPKEILDLYRDCKFMATPDLPIHPWQIESAPYGTGEVRKDLLRGYYAAVTAMDQNIGLILDKLEEKNLLDQTLIIFTSDNGMNMGHHGIWGKGNGTFPLNMFDTSVKVPFIISYPKTVPANQICDKIASHYDILPTIVDFLDLQGEVQQKLPGKSFADILKGQDSDDSGSIVVFDEYGPVRMIRNKKWKYIHRYPYGPNELYHIEEDPNEENNLIDSAEHQDIVIAMKKELTNWFYQYTDPKVDGARENVTGMGQLRRAGVYAKGQKVYHDR